MLNITLIWNHLGDETLKEMYDNNHNNWTGD